MNEKLNNELLEMSYISDEFFKECKSINAKYRIPWSIFRCKDFFVFEKDYDIEIDSHNQFVILTPKWGKEVKKYE